MYIFGDPMLQVNVTELRQRLPSYLEKVQQGEELQITLHGKVIARIVPEQDPAEAARQRLIAMRDKCRIGDVISPIDVEWSADIDNL
jgi:prevent-host-death family protein